MMEKMHENKAREQEEKMQKEEATNCLDLHPWVQYYRNENLEVPPDTLAASFFELQMAYGLFLGPAPSRALVLNRFPKLTEDDLALAQNSANAENEDLAKAGIALQRRCRQLLPLTEYHEPAQAVDMCLEFLSQHLVSRLAVEA